MTLEDRVRALDRTRAMALVAVAVTLGASLQVMYHFIDVVGVPLVFLGLVAVSLAGATALARVLRPTLAVAVGFVLLVAGLGFYISQLTGPTPFEALLVDVLALLTGQSLLGISNIRTWVIGVTPAPVFLTWYFALRRWYTPAVIVAGATLGFFVLTGDADIVTTLTGVVAGAAAVGLGDYDRRGEPVARTETILVVVSAMILIPALVPVIPGTASASSSVGPSFEGTSSLENNLVGNDEDVTVEGTIELSPQVRFVVTSDGPAYWRVASYDRYTGDGWVRTGGASPYQGGSRDAPPGNTTTVTQTVRLESDSDVVPAAWKPVEVSGVDGLQVRDDGSFQVADTVESGETYRVESEAPDPSANDLQEAGTDYPEDVEETYTQLPDSTPDRVEERTDTLTAEAETPYEQARVVEQWLESNKNYSLDVPRPRDDVADTFLFEMEAGYCTYFASTMVTMLRTQDVPARFVTGYSSGERVAEDQWVVRGQNAHAWVEVYFPDVGWVQFDPTPNGPRDAARDQTVEQARQQNVSNVDAAGSTEEGEWTPTPTDSPEPLSPETSDETATNTSNVTVTNTPDVPGGIITRNISGAAEAGTETPSGVIGRDDGSGLRAPTRHQFALGAVAIAGAAVGIRRSRAGKRAYRWFWLRYQPRTEPAADVERAFQRLVYHLGQQHYRSRWDHETARDFFDAVGASDDAHRVLTIRERARYAGEVSEDDADEAVRLVDEIVR